MGAEEERVGELPEDVVVTRMEGEVPALASVAAAAEALEDDDSLLEVLVTEGGEASPEENKLESNLLEEEGKEEANGVDMGCAGASGWL